MTNEPTAPAGTGRGPVLPLLEDAGIQRVLCIAAHPDDMEYGASAAVAEWSSRGIEVAYLLLTAGEAGIRGLEPGTTAPLRAAEQQAACDIVGAKGLTILDFPDGLLQPDLALRERIAHHIRRFRPDAVLTMTWDLETPWGINHADHRAAGLAVVDAIRDADNPWLFRSGGSDDPEAWATTWLLVGGARATHAIPVSERAAGLGAASLGAHVAYLAALPDHPDPREMVLGLLGRGGQAAGVPYALAVRAIRMG